VPEDRAEFPDDTLLHQCPDRTKDRLLVHPRPGGEGAEGSFLDGEIALQLPQKVILTVIVEMFHFLKDLPLTTEGLRVLLLPIFSQLLTASLIAQSNCT
jgi:hypothetical protein